MLWGIKKPHQKIKENPKKRAQQKATQIPPSPRSPDHCTACPCPPALLHFIVQLPHDKCAPSGKSNRSRSRSHSRSRSQLRVEVEIKAKKKAETFRLWILRQIWVICKGWSRRTGGSNWPEREKKVCYVWSNDSEYCIPCKPKGE